MEGGDHPCLSSHVSLLLLLLLLLPPLLLGCYSSGTFYVFGTILLLIVYVSPFNFRSHSLVLRLFPFVLPFAHIRLPSLVLIRTPYSVSHVTFPSTVTLLSLYHHLPTWLLFILISNFDSLCLPSYLPISDALYGTLTRCGRLFPGLFRI